MGVRVQYLLKVNIDNGMARLGPKCSSCCVRRNTYNAVTNGTHAHTHKHTHTHTHKHRHTHTRTHTHTHQSVQKNEEYKILWDFNVQADTIIEDR